MDIIRRAPDWILGHPIAPSAPVVYWIGYEWWSFRVYD